MKKFILKSLFFVFSSLLLINLAGFLILQFSKPMLYANDRFVWINKLKKKPDTVILGTSTLRYGLNPKIVAKKLKKPVGSVVNVTYDAYSSVNLYYAYKSVEDNIDPHAKVFYGLDPWVFSEKYYKQDKFMPMEWGVTERFQYLKDAKKISDRFAKSVFGLDSQRVKDVFKKFNAKIIRGRRIPRDYGAKVLKRKPKNFKTNLEDVFSYDYYGFSSAYFKYLKKIKDEVEKKGGEFILVIPPKQSRWVKAYKQKCKRIDNDFVTLIDRYLGDVKVIGSYYLIPSNLEKKMFNDAIHLNKFGMKYFSESFAEDINKVDRLKPEKMRHTFDY